MKKILSVLIFAGLLFNSAVFAQKSRSVKTNPVAPVAVAQSDFVVFGATKAFSDGGGVFLRWQTESETKTLGFRVYRADGKNKTLVNGTMLPGGLMSGEENSSARTYTFFDALGDANSIYYLEALSFDGHWQLSNPVYTEYINDMKTVAGASSEALKQSSEAARPEIISNNLVMPKELEATVTANRLPADIVKQRLIAGQPGVKIGIKKEGVFQVTKAQLQAAGFDVNSSPALWQLYRNGVEQSMTVAPNGDYIEFYGTGIDTLESDTQIYYLIVGAQNGQRIGTSIQRPFAGNVEAQNFFVNHVQKMRAIYNSNVLNGDNENFYDNVAISSGGRTLQFNVNSIDFSVRKVSFKVSVQPITIGPHSVHVLLNGQDLGFLTGDDMGLMSTSFGTISSYFVEGANTLQLISSGITDVSFLESLELDYARLYKAQNNQLSFYTNPYRASNLGGFTTSNIRVFNLNFPDNPTVVTNLAITQNGGGDYSVRLPANRSNLLFAVENSAILQPASIVPNVPSTLFNAAHNANLVIVSYRDWLTQAETWANYRRAQGLTVEVINLDDIYDEFSYGGQNTHGIESFIQHAQSNWQTQYVLLLGDASYDFRQYNAGSAPTFIPTRLVDTTYMETGSDEALADFNDDGLAEVAVGRITAKVPADVTQALNRVIAFEPTVPNWINRGALFAYDQPEGYDFEALSHRVHTNLPPNMPTTFILRYDPDPETSHTQLIAAMNTGKYIVNYSGHGSTGFWGFQPNPVFFNNADALALNNGGPNLSLFVMLTCLNGYFLNTSDSLAENLMRAPNGGAIIAWTSTGKTTPDIQEPMAARFYEQMRIGNMTRIGDLIKDAKTFLTGGRDVKLSWVLLGDPTLKVR